MMINRRNGGALAGILATIAVLVLIFAGLGLAFGWVTMSDSPDRSTIEINKTELKKDTDEAVKATEKFIQDSADSVEQASEEASDNLTTDNDQETITPVPEETRPQPVEPENDAS
ncbi:hypothetical protein [Bremerella alba]|uniref:Uncharacterized protein n=1 Tax=Bremerella alba TaxID=980252 RepID=A0A7V8V2C6_9BACT|nr:hypothetical protein [Bremerella alba]MBA2113611.1 hypothetical protein [Bremerella alba]